MSEEKYSQAKAERAKHGEAILASPSLKKLVVAGPGTGKTHLFKQVLHGKKNTVTLSFVRSLVTDLSLELCGLSDVRTLHSFARGALAKATGNEIQIHPHLSHVVKDDAKILLNRDVDFDKIFHERDDHNEHLPFYKKRKDYYGHYGYEDIVFGAARYFEENQASIPAYEQVVVDEFQDFNPLEVSLIDLLAKKSPVLIAGDDDQALYDFKHASAAHIRQRHAPGDHGYSAFNLPFCSRCTRVIVDATNDLVQSATAHGHLIGRINKPYNYFEDEAKDRESAKYQKIIHARMHAKQIPWFIHDQMGAIAEEVRRSFTVLVISPTKVQSGAIIRELKKRGLKNIDFVERKDDSGPSLLDALKLMIKPKHGYSNLGWRIAAAHLLTEDQLAAAVHKSAEDKAKLFHELVPKPTKILITKLAQTLRALRDEKDVTDADIDTLLKQIEFDARAMAVNQLREEIATDESIGNPTIKGIPVKATTIPSSKGLAADYVFITHFDDTYFIRDKDKTKVSDLDVCNMLVALTRAKKKVYLLSSKPNLTPHFRAWIKDERIEDLSLVGE